MGSFEKEIRQNVFKNDISKAMLNVMYTANWIRDHHAHIFNEYGIRPQHYNVLRIVKGRKGDAVSPGQIIEVMIDKGRDLTRLVDKLVIMGYLERSQSPLNKRKVDISITQKGIEITNEIEVKLDNWVNKHIHMSEDKALGLNTYLDMLRGEN
jgi:DNA-binding MarR family transcriptional regulator